MTNSIEIKNLTKHYPNFSMEHLSFYVPQGSIVGLIGENGAGKTTLIKSMLDIIHPEEGEVVLLGNSNLRLAKQEIGVVLDGAFFAELMMVKDVNRVMKEFYSSWDSAFFFETLKKFGVPLHQAIKTLSKGMRKKLEIATALAHHPKLLILDEPTSGIDPVVRSDILDLFLEFIQEEDHSILLSTHITSDLEQIADYIAFLDHGQLIFQKSKEELKETIGILRCEEAFFQALDPSFIIRYKKNRYNYDVLIDSLKDFKKQYPDAKLDPITIDEMMVLYIKGERK